MSDALVKAGDTDLTTWKSLRRLPAADLKFVMELRRGVPLLDAYRNSDEGRKGANSISACRRLMEVRSRLPAAFDTAWMVSSRALGRRLRVEATLDEMLENDDPNVQSLAISHIRAIDGMDAPKQSQISISPHLVGVKIVSEPVLMEEM